MFFRKKPFKNEAHANATHLLWLMLEKHTGIPYQIIEMQFFSSVKVVETEPEDWFNKAVDVFYDWDRVWILNLY